MLRLFTLFMLAPSLALAAGFPVSGPYGTPYGCETLKGGENTSSANFDADWVLVTKATIAGHEWECTPGKPLGGGKIALSCNEAGDEGAGSTSWVILKEAGGVLDYRDESGPLTLHACK